MATPRDLVRRLNDERGHGWVYDSRTRGAFNVVTQDRVSRRQLDKLEGGKLATEGYTSYEAKAKARAARGLKGFRQTRPGVFEKVVSKPRERKGVLQGLPERANVRVLVQGNDPRNRYNKRATRGVWRHLNFGPAGYRAAPMSPGDILSVWDSRASRAGKVVGDADRWVIRVTIPQ